MRRLWSPAAVAAVGAVLLALLWLVVHGVVPALDLWVADAVAAADSTLLDRVASIWTRLGDTPVAVGIAAGLTAARAARRDLRGAAFVALPVTVAMTATAGLKLLSTRGRPEVGAQLEDTFAWPSGHSTAGLVVALVVVLVVAHRGRAWRPTAAVVLPVGLGVGVSRVLLSVHWVTDVLAGWLVAVIAVAFVLAVLPDGWLPDGLRAGRAPAPGDDPTPRDRPA